MERRIGVELRMLNNAVARYLSRNVYRTDDGVTPTCENTWIIGYLSKAEGDVFQKDIEAEFGITRSTASKVLILMEKKGLIERVGVSHDARLKKLVLTEKAKRIAEQMSEDGRSMEKRLIQGFSQEELDTLLSYFERMMTNLSGDRSTLR